MAGQNGCRVLAARIWPDHPAETRNVDGSGKRASTWEEARAYLELFLEEFRTR